MLNYVGKLGRIVPIHQIPFKECSHIFCHLCISSCSKLCWRVPGSVHLRKDSLSLTLVWISRELKSGFTVQREWRQSLSHVCLQPPLSCRIRFCFLNVFHKLNEPHCYLAWPIGNKEQCFIHDVIWKHNEISWPDGGPVRASCHSRPFVSLFKKKKISKSLCSETSLSSSLFRFGGFWNALGVYSTAVLLLVDLICECWWLPSLYCHLFSWNALSLRLHNFSLE